MTRPIQIKTRAGLNTTNKNNRLASSDLSSALNVDLDDSGSISRRDGFTQAVSGDCHSITAQGGNFYAVRDGFLGLFLPPSTFSPLAPVASAYVSYEDVNGALFYSDGRTLGIVEFGVAKPYGVPVPDSPVLTSIPGGMRSGTYAVAATYVRADGRESGAPEATFIRGASGLRITWPTWPAGVQSANVYMTHLDGSELFFVGSILAGTATTDITDTPVYSYSLTTQFKQPLPAGTDLTYKNGRLYTAVGNFVLYSDPYTPDLYSPAYNYLGFSSAVTMIAAVDAGLFVGTEDETYFLAGEDPSNYVVGRPSITSGVRRRSKTTIPTEYFMDGKAGKDVVLWMSATGVCAGLSTGEVVTLTSDKYLPPSGQICAAGAKYRNGAVQYVASIFE